VYKFKKSLVALIGLASLMTVGTVVMPHTGYGSGGAATSSAPTAQTQNVNVVNTPTVKSQQDGAWIVGLASGSNIGISGTPSVNVANTPTVGIDPASNGVQVGNDSAHPVLVRDVDNSFASQQPYAESIGVSIDDGQSSGSGSFTPVPQGKILVLEQISLVARLTGQKLVAARIEGPNGLRYYLMPTDQGTDVLGRNVFITSQHGRFYFTAGQQATCTAERNGTAGQAVADCSVSGYLAEAP